MEIEQLKKLVLEFRDKRDWKQFHNPKDLATAVAIEASELQEKFLWRSQKDSYEIGRNDPEVADEVADVFNFLLLFVDSCGIDLEKAFLEKLEKNNQKYDAEKSK
jgi:NTP pyrophosphatase (non-canonical NTP hydrolase)